VVISAKIKIVYCRKTIVYLVTHKRFDLLLGHHQHVSSALYIYIVKFSLLTSWQDGRMATQFPYSIDNSSHTTIPVATNNK